MAEGDWNGLPDKSIRSKINWQAEESFAGKKFESPNDPRYPVRMKNLDLKSFAIGFLLASVLLLGIGATSKTVDVRIVGIDKHYADWDPLVVQIKK